MSPSFKMPRALRYPLAVLASLAAVGLVMLLEPVVGFIPLLLLPAVALVERYAGPKPAILTTVLCTLGSFLYAGSHPEVDARIHDLSKLALFPFVAASIVYLMEARRKQHRVVQEQLRELSTLLDSMPEAVFIFDHQGLLVDLNRAAEQLCDSPRDELRGMPYRDFAVLLSARRDDRPLTPSETAVARALRGEPVHNEPRMLLRPRDRAEISALVTASPMHGDGGTLIGALLVVRDVTEIVQLQRRIADTERHLAIGQMASGIAHDFNNVLNTITQAVALLEMRPDQTPEERAVYLHMIDRAARTGSEIIKRVREYIRGGTGILGPVDVPRLLHEALELTLPMQRKVRGLDVQIDFKPVSMVRANRADLQRVFTNLVINALQAMPQGGRLRLECEQREGTVYVRVHDTGHGIPAEEQKNIFLPYYTTKPHGTGLGLSTAQKILLAQGGNLSFTSEAGRGTTFTVQLPAMTAPVEAPEETERQPANAA